MSLCNKELTTCFLGGTNAYELVSKNRIISRISRSLTLGNSINTRIINRKHFVEDSWMIGWNQLYRRYVVFFWNHFRKSLNFIVTIFQMMILLGNMILLSVKRYHINIIKFNYNIICVSLNSLILKSFISFIYHYVIC